MHRFALVLGLLAVLSPCLPAREFSSADGSKKMEGEFLRFNGRTGMVTLKLNGKNVVMPATAFSQEDQAFFDEEQKKVDMQESVSVKIDTKSRTDRSKDDKGKKTSVKHTEYSFVVKNNSQSKLEGMKLKYWVLVETENKEDRDSTISEKTDEVTVDALEPGEETRVSGPTITQTQSSGGKGKGKGTEVRIYGAKAQLISPSGEELGSDTSSDRVNKYLDR